MTTPTPGEGQDPAPVAGSEQEPQDAQVFPADYVRELRRESAGYRTRAKEAEERLSALEAARQAAEEQTLADQAKWEELAKKREAELASLKGIQDKHAAVLATIAEGNQKRIDGLPEQYKTLVPEFDDPLKTAQWLDANWATLTRPPAPDLNGGAGGGKRPSQGTRLTEAELRVATGLGLTPEEYADAKPKR